MGMFPEIGPLDMESSINYFYLKNIVTDEHENLFLTAIQMIYMHRKKVYCLTMMTATDLTMSLAVKPYKHKS